MNPIDKYNSLVIDLTYNCNAKCGYCRWGDSTTPNRVNQPDSNILIDKETLKNLKAERVVFSGGEPLLRKDLETIVAYYKKLEIPSIVMITNGLLLEANRLESLVSAGLTGITFSLDGADYETLRRTRGYSRSMVDRIMRNVSSVLSLKSRFGLEVGVNCVVSKGNLSKDSLVRLLEFCESSVDWLKFNPVFDDGYAGQNSPHLLFSSDDSEEIRKIGRLVLDQCLVATNSSNFWNVFADVVSGKSLDGSSCHLDGRQSLALRGELKFCAWLDEPVYGSLIRPITQNQIAKSTESYQQARKSCKTGPWCFCLQKLSHQWKVK